MIADPAGASQQFDDQAIQDTLDETRDFIRYEPLKIAPTILNAATTNNTPVTIFADYFSQYQWWEQDVVLQGNNVNTAASWIVMSPLSSDYINGHWQFELNVFTTGTAPGQYPPVFATGQIYDLNWACADLLEYWAMVYSGAYDITVDGQGLRRSQLMTAKQAASEYFRKRARPRIVKQTRGDIQQETRARRFRLLDSDDILKGA
jgi:hypothetical protein